MPLSNNCSPDLCTKPSTGGMSGRVAQRGLAASEERSAFSDQLRSEGKHSFDIGGWLRKPRAAGLLRKMKVAGEKQMILQFRGGTACDHAEASQLRVTLRDCDSDWHYTDGSDSRRARTSETPQIRRSWKLATKPRTETGSLRSRGHHPG